MPAPINRVQPGDLITADLINSILDHLGALENRSAETQIILGPLSTGTHTLLSLGSGFESAGGIYLDGVSLLSQPPARGINLVILDPNLGIKFRSGYDTFGSSAAAAQLVTDLGSHTSQYDVVIAATHDAYATQLGDDAKAALAAVGGAALGKAPSSRANAALIGVVPAKKDNVSFDYLVSVMPADGPGFVDGRLAGLPLVWGIYSVPLQRFLLGGASGTIPAAPAND